ncbi:NUDIX hydrolase [Eupransor demetentiae]|uniref:NUDIX family (MutT) n=1 Tax=Eupransor demetentiae TaxID=3109584 RepID=A0ABP0EU37_9LACO|nr:8-oxo-dGTP pyrophosphatase MutT and related house-cleaning NTP pyrophosphohydrolases [Lactobacillaceae bacterium LMG 33000]
MSDKVAVKKLRQLMKGAVFTVDEEEITLPGEKPFLRQVVNTTDSVTIAVVKEIDGVKNVLVEKEYRAPIKSYSWGLPAGRIDEGEEPKVAAKRETQEETGYKIDQEGFVEVENANLSNGIISEKSYIFTVSLDDNEVEKVGTHFDGDEYIGDYQFVPVTKALEMVDGAASKIALLYLLYQAASQN